MERKPVYNLVNFQAFLKSVDAEGTVKRVVNLYPDGFFDSIWRATTQCQLQQYQFINIVMKAVLDPSHVVEFHSYDHATSFVLEFYPRFGFHEPNTADLFESFIGQILYFIEEKTEISLISKHKSLQDDLPF